MYRFSRTRKDLWISAIGVVLLAPESAVLGQLVWSEQADRVLPPRNPQAWDGFVHGQPSVELVNGEFCLWYGGADNVGGVSIGRTASRFPDAFPRPSGPILGGLREGPEVLTWLEDGAPRTRIWFDPFDAGFIEHATLAGVAVRIDPPRPLLEADQPWEGNSVLYPGVVRTPDGSFHMWYEGARDLGAGRLRIGYATSEDGLTWEKYDENPVLGPGGGDGAAGTGEPDVIFIESAGTFEMWYQTLSADLNSSWVAFATSMDGVAWSQHGRIALPAKTFIHHPSVLFDDDIYHMWYGWGAFEAIGYATSEWTTPRASFEVVSTDGATVRFDSARSTTPAGEIVGYTWDFGDGSEAVTGNPVEHRYAKPGDYDVTLTVTDDEGNSGSVARRVTVPATPVAEFLRGDCNGDSGVDVSDPVCILNWLFAGAAAPGCIAATDTNSDGEANVADATFLLNHLFAGGAAPSAPFPDCGSAPVGALSCSRSCEVR